jgi:excisionase family DNA binding protein
MLSKYTAYTAEDDRLLIALYPTTTPAAIMARLGRTCRSGYYTHVRLLEQRGILNVQQRYGFRRWTSEEDQELRARWGWASPAEIAASLGRSRNACNTRAQRLRVADNEQKLTISWVARLFGVEPGAVRRWIRRRWLPATRTDERRGRWRLWRISLVALERFITRYPEHYDWRRIPQDSYWREVARVRAAATGYLTTVQAARRLGAHPATLARHCREGKLPAVRTTGASPHGTWRIREADLRYFTPLRPGAVGKRRRQPAVRPS